MPSGDFTIQIEIPGEPGLERILLAVVESLGTPLGLIPPDKIPNLRTALAEAILNAMEHGNRGDHRLEVSVRFVVHPQRLEIIVEDTGVGGEIQLSTEKPDIRRKVSGLESKRGWGLFLIQNLVDELSVEKLADNRNRLRMVSYLRDVHK